MYKKVLVPLDGSDLAECSLPVVKNMLKEGFAKEVVLLNVFSSHIPLAAEGEAAPMINVFEMRERIRGNSLEYIAGVKEKLAAEGLKVRTESLEGDRPADIITDYARKNAVDMIVIASHGYTGLKKLMFGSVALEILHDSHVPVLLIRPESCRA